MGARTADAAIARGEHVIYDRADQPVVRTSDPKEAARIASRIGGYTKPAVV